MVLPACVKVLAMLCPFKSFAESACILQTIEDGLRQLDGVDSVSVALLAEKATIIYNEERWTPSTLAGVSSARIRSDLARAHLLRCRR